MDAALHPVPGHPGLFATLEGRIFSDRRGALRELQGSRHVDGYRRIRTGPQEVPDVNRHFVHELVALTFLGPKPQGHQTRHLDGDPSNNRVANLAYGTPVENRGDAAEHGTIPIGLANGRAYVPDAIVRAVVLEVRGGAEIRATAHRHGVNERTVRAWVSGRSRRSALLSAAS